MEAVEKCDFLPVFLEYLCWEVGEEGILASTFPRSIPVQSKKATLSEDKSRVNTMGMPHPQGIVQQGPAQPHVMIPGARGRELKGIMVRKMLIYHFLKASTS